MSFNQIIGQDKPVSILRNAIKTSRMAHAYIFDGPSGCGKVFTALNFIKAINCLMPDGLNSCDQCSSCKKIDAKNHMDIAWITLLKDKSHISIDQIRQMQSEINLKPYEAKFKVFCIQDAELMNDEAQSALLKTLEEPPVKSIIILTTSNPMALLVTISSRCQLVKFSALKLEYIMEIFAKRYAVGLDTAHFLAYMAQSGLMDACVKVSGDILKEKNSIIDEFNNFLKNPSDIEKLFLKDTKEHILWVLLILMWWHRDMLIFKETGQEKILANKDRINDLKLRADNYSSSRLGQIITVISKTLQLMRQTNVNAKLALTVMAADILNASVDPSLRPPSAGSLRTDV